MNDVVSLSIEEVDFKKINNENFRDFLELFGFRRYVQNLYLIPEKTIDSRLIDPDKSPEGLYPGFIVPSQNLGKTMFIINVDILNDLLVNLKQTQFPIQKKVETT